MACAALFLLCACQQAGNAPRPETSARSAGDGDPHYFEPEFDGLLSQMIAKLGGACASHADNPQSWDRCLRDRFAQAFDDSGQGRKACEHHSGLTDFIGCIALGNTFLDIRRRLLDTSPVPAGFWSGDGAMVDAVMDSVVRHGMVACGTSGSEPQLVACVDSWFEKQLDLPETLVARCRANAAADAQQGCFGEAVMLRYLQDHVPRLDAVSA
jgi:hypothetical protein